MKTTSLTAVNEIIRKIEAINKDYKYLKECTEISFIVGNTQQKRITITDNMPVYALLLHSYWDHLTRKKDGLITSLKNEYNVEYDGE